MSPRTRREVRWLEVALQDLCEIVEYIAQEAPEAAERFADAVFAKVDLLEELPYLGGACPHHRRARQLIHGNHIIYYTVHRHEVVVRAVVHGARLFQSHWLERGERD